MMMNRESQIQMINNMANTLLLLSKANQNGSRKRVFTCKTCQKEFPSFQALGGHRASHKKAPAFDDSAPISPVKPKKATHECSICGAEFAIGQALGGHMRRHRNVMSGGAGEGGGGRSSVRTPTAAAALFPVPVMMKKSSGNGNSKRVLCLDLNLTPLENDDLKLELGRLVC